MVSVSLRVSNGPQILPVPSIRVSNSRDSNVPPTTQYRDVLMALYSYAAAEVCGPWNCAFSVESESAVVEALPPVIVRLTRSK